MAVVNLNQKFTQCNLFFSSIPKKRSINTQTVKVVVKRNHVFTQTRKERISKYDIENLDIKPRLPEAITQIAKVEKSNSTFKVNTIVQTEINDINETTQTDFNTVNETTQTDFNTVNEAIQTDEYDEVFESFPHELGKYINQVIRLYKSLSCVEKISSEKQSHLEITRKGFFVALYNSDSCNYILTDTGELKLCSKFKGVVKEYRIIIDGEFQIHLVNELLKNFASESFVFCQGLGHEVNNTLAQLPNKPKQLEVFKFPAEHFISTKCESFFKRAVNVKINICKNCNALQRYLRVCLKRRARKFNSDPSSTIPSQYLPPRSVLRKQRLTRYRVTNMKRPLLFSRKNSGQIALVYLPAKILAK